MEGLRKIGFGLMELDEGCTAVMLVRAVVAVPGWEMMEGATLNA